MFRGHAVVLAGLMVLASGSVRAMDQCTFAVRPETSGFVLNPIVNRVVVVSAKPEKSGSTCSLRADDEILQVNEQVIPGQRAVKIMSYWKSLKKQDPCTFKVRRGDSIVIVMTR